VTLFALSGMLIGAILGVRFTVFALVPAMTCTLIIAGASAVFSGLTIVELTLFLTCLQIGYLCSAALRYSLDRQINPGVDRPSSEPSLPSSHSH
jgi:hypothetical protein